MRDLHETTYPDLSRLTVVPVTLKEARAYVTRHHRHHRAPHMALFAVAVGDSEGIHGVAVLSQPTVRMLCDGWTVEVSRCCTDGAKNACSMLYGAAWRAVKALGYRRCVTYTLPEEGGSSLRGAGWTCVGRAGGGSWNRTDRPRVDMAPTQVKMRWEMKT